MARDQASSPAGAGDAGGPNERPDTGDAGRGDDPWRRIDSERSDRAEHFKKADLQHDPSEEFEQAGRVPARDTSRDRELTVDAFTPQQRADLEQAHGRPLEDIVAHREQARAAEATKPDTAPEALQPRADLPSDDVYNELVAAYNRGDLPYHDVRDRFASLDASPVHAQPQPTDTGDNDRNGHDNQGDQADLTEQTHDQSDRSDLLQAPSDRTEGAGREQSGDDGTGVDTGDARAADAAGGSHDVGDGSDDGPGTGDRPVPHPDEPDGRSNDNAAETPDGPGKFPAQLSERSGTYVTVLIDEHGQPDWRHARLADGEPFHPDQFIEVDESDPLHTARDGSSDRDPSADDEHSAGLISTDHDQPSEEPDVVRTTEADDIAPHNEPTTEIVDTKDDGFTHERPEPTLQPPQDSKANKVDNLARESWYISNLHTAGEYNVDLAQDYFDRPKPTGAQVIVTPENAGLYQSPKDAMHGGEITVAPLALYAVVTGSVRLAQRGVAHLKHSRGDSDGSQ